MPIAKDGSLDERLRLHVERLAGEIGVRNVYRSHALHAAEAFLRDTWTAYGYEVTAQEYEVSDVRCANLEVTLPGAKDRATILVGAHYDTVQSSPGADDNASGIAVLLELTHLLQYTRPQCELRFVAFVNEEAPFFFTGQQGSSIYAQAARRRGDRIRCMLSLEMLGYYSDTPGRRYFVGSIRIGVISLRWSQISAPGARCGAWRPSFAHQVLFRSSTSRPFPGFPVSPGATIGHSGGRVTLL